jgi:hypothetical protein
MEQDKETTENDLPKAKRSRAKVGVTTAKKRSQSGVAGTKAKKRSQQDFIHSLSTVLRSFEKRLVDEKDFKPTLAEYLKLRQFERELQLDAELPREIKITWIEPDWASKET